MPRKKLRRRPGNPFPAIVYKRFASLDNDAHWSHTLNILGALLKHYKIPADSENKWQALCWRLAFDHFPGMHKKQKSTTPRKAQTLRLDFFDAVDREMAAGAPSQAEAIMRIIQRNPDKWADGARSKDLLKKKARQWQTRYSEMKKAFR
jgi:hypothetical protein